MWIYKISKPPVSVFLPGLVCWPSGCPFLPPLCSAVPTLVCNFPVLQSHRAPHPPWISPGSFLPLCLCIYCVTWQACFSWVLCKTGASFSDISFKSPALSTLYSSVLPVIFLSQTTTSFLTNTPQMCFPQCNVKLYEDMDTVALIFD
jgi:hypothetical protein